jgi:two-component system sensor histidine kinase SenX3
MSSAFAVSRAPRPLALAVGLAGLLAVLAALQYRWTGEMSRAEGERMQNGLRAASLRFAHDLDHEVASVAPFFFPMPGGADDRAARWAERFQEWAQSAHDPKLVRDILLLETSGDGGLPQLSRLDPEAPRFERVDWTPELDALRRRSPDGRLPPIMAEIPAIVLPLGGRRREMRPAPGPAPDGALVIQLDPERIVQMMPDLAERYFGDAADSAYDLTVVRRTRGRDAVVYRSPGAPPETRRPDITVPLLDFRGLEDERGGPGLFRGLRFGGRRRGFWGGPPPPPPGESPDWELRVTHRAGSLEAAVARARARNLSVGFGVLVLLAASMIFVVVSAQRAQRLAQQQIEFVAAVSHEMHTPLAAIRSAGGNLADGVVHEPAQVQRYGAMIETEGRRLSSMVAQALEFAGIQSGRQQYRMEDVTIADVVDAALDECRFTIEEKNLTIERDLPDALPRLQADPAALRTALKNLIENALKYGDPTRAIGVAARLAGSEVQLSVRDHGPGIAESDRPHVFEPFYRGRGNGTRVQGSGLGLSVVRHIVAAHGGSVGFETGADGTTFTLHLPVAAPAARETRA